MRNLFVLPQVERSTRAKCVTIKLTPPHVPDGACYHLHSRQPAHDESHDMALVPHFSPLAHAHARTMPTRQDGSGRRMNRRQQTRGRRAGERKRARERERERERVRVRERERERERERDVCAETVNGLGQTRL